jgi:prolyl-tRNA synthetase
MTHSDDKGLVLPPPVSPVQVVIVPITKGDGQEHDNVMKEIQGIVASLKSKKIRVKVDDRDNIRPGAKYFEWERKGVPLRIDIGPRDVSAKTVPMTVRFSGEKSVLSITDLSTMTAVVQSQLDKIHKDLFLRAQNRIAEKTFKLSSYSEMKAMIQESTINSGSTDSESSGKGNFQKAGFYLVPWKVFAILEFKYMYISYILPRTLTFLFIYLFIYLFEKKLSVMRRMKMRSKQTVKLQYVATL